MRFVIETSTETRGGGGADTETRAGVSSILGSDGGASLATKGDVDTGAGNDGMEPRGFSLIIGVSADCADWGVWAVGLGDPAAGDSALNRGLSFRRIPSAAIGEASASGNISGGCGLGFGAEGSWLILIAKRFLDGMKTKSFPRGR